MSMHDILIAAINAEFGIAITTKSHESALQLRRKLYSSRESLRGEGYSHFDDLSFIILANNQLLIIKRAALPEQIEDSIDLRPLQKQELPKRILARGRSKVGSFSSSYLRALE